MASPILPENLREERHFRWLGYRTGKAVGAAAGVGEDG